MGSATPQIMGLDIKVVKDDEKSFRFGAYLKFARFRADLAEYTHGKTMGDEYRRWIAQPPAYMTEGLPADVLLAMGIKPRTDLSPEFKQLDIWPIYTLSDCEQEITEQECSCFFAIMDTYKKVLRRKNVDAEFKESYKQLMAAFKAGMGDSEEVGVIFQ